MIDWQEHRRINHDLEVERGEHDAECEWDEKSFCDCSRRSRIASGLLVPPTLSTNYPTCNNCYQEVESDGDGWNCRKCHTHWPYEFREDEPGNFTDE